MIEQGAVSTCVCAVIVLGSSRLAHLEEDVAAREKQPAGRRDTCAWPVALETGAAQRGFGQLCAGVRDAIADARVEGLNARADRAARARARGNRCNDKAAEHHKPLDTTCSKWWKNGCSAARCFAANASTSAVDRERRSHANGGASRGSAAAARTAVEEMARAFCLFSSGRADGSVNKVKQ